MNYRLHWIVGDADGRTEANDEYLCRMSSRVGRVSCGRRASGERPKEGPRGPGLEPESTERDRPTGTTLASS